MLKHDECAYILHEAPESFEDLVYFFPFEKFLCLLGIDDSGESVRFWLIPADQLQMASYDSLN